MMQNLFVRILLMSVFLLAACSPATKQATPSLEPTAAGPYHPITTRTGVEEVDRVLEAIASLGMANSRMKDFYDVAVLARDFEFDGPLLSRAIHATFERRKTPLPTTTPVALTAAFAEEATKKTQWSGFVRKGGVRYADGLAETIAAVRAFVEAPLAAAANGTPAPGTWRAGGAWG